MKTLSLYLIRQFLGRCALVLVGTAAFALAADLMETGKDVVSMREDSWRVLLDYGLLRLPTYVSALLPVSALIAGLAPSGVGVGIPDTELFEAEIEAMVGAGVFAELPDWESMVNTSIAAGLYDGTTLAWPS